MGCKPQKGGFDPEQPEFPEFAQTAVKRALEDCQLKFDDVQFATVGCIGNTGNGQRCLYEMGMNGIPIFNVSNACATGSNALFLSKNMIAGGQYDCALALGIEIMKPGPLAPPPTKEQIAKRKAAAAEAKASGKTVRRPAGSLEFHMKAMATKFDLSASPPMAQMFANAGREHMELYGSEAKHYAMIGEKNHRHSANNPYSQFRDVYSLEEVEKSPMQHSPVTKLQCSPTSDGAAAAILCSEEFVIKHGLEGQAVEIIGQGMKTDFPSAFEGDKPRTCINMVGFEMAQKAAEQAYSQAGVKATDVQVVELHDCFSPNELLSYEALGLCGEGEGHKMVERGDNTFGGKYVVNPSGGLISKGHPIGATGVAQCCELNWQLRQEAGPRQVPNAKIALQHNLGLTGNVVVSIYRKPEEWKNKTPVRKVSGAMGFPEMHSRL